MTAPAMPCEASAMVINRHNSSLRSGVVMFKVKQGWLQVVCAVAFPKTCRHFL
jgi:hypothetical protein